MGFLKWNITGPYEVNVEVAGHMKASVSREFPDRFRLSLVPIDMDGMSAVAKRNGDYKIYGATRMRAYIRPNIKQERNHTFMQRWARVCIIPSKCQTEATRDLPMRSRVTTVGNLVGHFT